ncbi:MAG: hypothetical protein ABEJ06_00275 [Haloarculaceae archaeon]
MPDDHDPIEASRDRKHEMAEHTERILAEAEELLAEHDYPANAAELAEAYAHQPADLPTDTETVGDVFDRLSERYDSAEEAHEALLNEITGDAAGAEEYNDQRDLEGLTTEEQADLDRHHELDDEREQFREDG